MLNKKLLVQKPQVNIGCSGRERIWLVNLCALLAIIQSSLSDAMSSLFLAFAAVTTAILTELILFKNEKHTDIKDGSSVAAALILVLFLPNNIPPVYAVMGTFFAITVIKHSFGGLGSNFLNTAAGGWLFIRCSWPGVFNEALEASPLPASGQILSGGSASGIIRTFLNSTVFNITGSELPGGYIELFAFSGDGIIADRGLLALLAGTIILLIFRVFRTWIPVVYLAVYAILVRITGDLSYNEAWWQGDMLLSLCSGGVIAAAFILITDPVTGAKSDWGILAACLCCGVLTWFFRIVCGETYGALFAVALTNVLTPLVRSIERNFLYRKSGAQNNLPELSKRGLP